MSSKTICSAGRIGQFSYMILNTGAGRIFTSIRDANGEITLSHESMDSATKYLNKEIDRYTIKRNNEIE